MNPSSAYTRKDPFLREFACSSFPSGAAPGDSFAFYIQAITIQTSADSEVSAPILLASVPGTPASAPTVVPQFTSGTQVSVAFNVVTDNGGSPITSYELQKGSLKLTDFVTISGEEPRSLALSFTVTKDVSKGAYYSFRYRAVNSVGAGDWSPVAKIQAASVPEAPPAPAYRSADSSSVTLTLTPPTENGGSKILGVKLFRDSGVKTSNIDVEVTGYAGETEYSVTGLTAKTTYRFACVAYNAYGESLQSAAVSVQTSTTPLQIAAPTVDWSKSSKTSLFIEWAAVSDPDASIQGYILQMDDGLGGAFTTIFKGAFEPHTLSFLKTGLVTGRKYRFKVRAAGYNEPGPESDVSAFYACASPSGFESPTRVSSTRTSIVIQWKAPADDGGCPLTEFAVFRDDGAGSAVSTELNSSSDPAVRGNPSLDTMEITNFPTSSEGLTFRIKVTAYNAGGREADSGAVAMVLASEPDSPTTAPVNDPTVTSASVIKVTYGIPAPDNGNSPILSFALEMDDGLGGEFKKLVGFTSNSLLTTYTISNGIVKGREYRLRYRVRNAIGYSGYSPIAIVLAASPPSVPPKPVFNGFATNTLNLNILSPQDNGGSPILSYKLYRDTGLSFSSSFSLIATLKPDSRSYFATAGADGYVVGLTYRFKVVAENVVGASEPSDEAYIAFGDVPPQPDPISAAGAYTSRQSIHVAWSAVVSPLPVSGYVLNMDDGRLGEMSVVYLGRNRPDLKEYTVEGLTTGLPYRFSVQAINSNGWSVASATTTLYA